MSQQFKKTQIATYVCIALSASASALAAEEAKDKNKAEETEVITVTGVRSSLTGALAAKRSADSISDSIIAEESVNPLMKTLLKHCLVSLVSL